MPQKDALAAMNAMGSAVPVEWDTRRKYTDSDWRKHYLVQAKRRRPDLALETVDDDQIHIPAELADEMESAPAPRRTSSTRRIQGARQPLLLTERGGSNA